MRGKRREERNETRVDRREEATGNGRKEEKRNKMSWWQGTSGCTLWILERGREDEKRMSVEKIFQPKDDSERKRERDRETREESSKVKKKCMMKKKELRERVRITSIVRIIEERRGGRREDDDGEKGKKEGASRWWRRWRALPSSFFFSFPLLSHLLSFFFLSFSLSFILILSHSPYFTRLLCL